MDVKIEPSWKRELEKEFTAEYFSGLTSFVKDEYAKTTVYPPPRFIFRAFELTPFDAVKVVILGQDPYHGPGQANGLAFSVSEGIDIPPSLRNIYREIQTDLGHKTTVPGGELEHWAKQGVLLLNATLTVRAHMAASHQNKGWEKFTDAVIRILSGRKDHLVFMLWGNYAQRKGLCIDTAKHLVIKSAHPSPLSAYNGFFGSRPFSKANAYLVEHGKTPIDW